MRIAVFTPLLARVAPRSGIALEPHDLYTRAEKLLRDLSDPAHLLRVTDSRDLAALPSKADVLLILLPAEWEAAPLWLRNLPEIPTVVLTDDVASAAVLLRRHKVFEILSADRLEVELVWALRLANDSSMLGSAVAIFCNNPSLSPALRRWAVNVLTARPPYAKVCTSAGRGRLVPAVRKEWERKIGRSSPKEFVRWVLMVHAAAHIDKPRLPLATVAAELQVSPGILERAAKSVLGISLRELPHDAGRLIRKGFWNYIQTTVGRSTRSPGMARLRARSLLVADLVPPS